ncbi:MAG: ABC transporter permease subunit [Myxococcales bacterium]|jgi:ABC-type transport system involved in multi-copper enzyme maturation permease subunit
MSRQLRSFWAVARLDLAEVLRSRWLLFCIVVYAVLAGVFLLVGMRESTVFGFTGTDRVLVSYVHALLVLLPLMALVATGQVVNRSRDDGTLELLFSQPISRGAFFSAISSVRFLVLLVPLALLMGAIGLFGRLVFGQPIAWVFIGHCLVLCAVLIWTFCGLGLWVSTTVQNAARGTMYLLLIWVAGIALLDFALAGMMLQWRIEPRVVFLLAALNPVQCIRMALLSSADPELSTLGPVGFYLANRIGSTALYALGVVWPMLLGALAWAAGLWRLRRGDVV